MSSKGGKSKNKKPVDTTLGKAPSQNDVDVAHLRRPIDTSLHGLQQVLALLKTATVEVKNYLNFECDIMYECKTCRTIFRSLANFILHKRSYCKQQYNPVNCKMNNNVATEEVIKTLDETSPSSKKELLPIIEKLHDKQKFKELAQAALDEDLTNKIKVVEEKMEDLSKQNILLEKIETNGTAVFQTMLDNVVRKQEKEELMKSEVMEIHGILDSDEVVLGPDGKICTFQTEKANEKSNIPKSIFMCLKCNQKFSTKKTLTYHIKYKHNHTRMVYVCPDCKDTFANAWCVYRHLYKVHRRTNAQVKRMRDQIHNTVIRNDQEPAKKRGDKNTEAVEKTDEENQWLNNFEGDKDLQMCGGCGKRFERKAALHSHSQMCVKRIAVCNSIKENSRKKENEQEKDQKTRKTEKVAAEVKGSAKRKPYLLRTYKPALKEIQTEPPDKKVMDINENLGKVEPAVSVSEEIDTKSLVTILEVSETEEKPSRRRSSEEIEFIGFGRDENNKIRNVYSVPDVADRLSCRTEEKLKSLSESNMHDDYEIIDLSGSINGRKWLRMREKQEQRRARLSSVDLPAAINESFAETYANFINKATPFMNEDTLTCNTCDIAFQSMEQILWHMSAHFSWFRFQCSRCSFVSFNKFDCADHAHSKHGTPQSAMDSVVLPIPSWKTVLMSHDFRPLRCSTDLGGKLTDEVIIVSEDSENSSDDKSSLEDSGTNLFSDCCAIKNEFDFLADVKTEVQVKNEVIDITDENSDSFQVELPQEIYIIDESAILKDDVDIQRINESEASVDDDESFLPKLENETDLEEEKYVPVKEEAPASNNCDMYINSRPARNRTKSIKTLQNDFIYDLTKVLKMNDAARGSSSLRSKRNSAANKQKEESKGSQCEFFKKRKVDKKPLDISIGASKAS